MRRLALAACVLAAAASTPERQELVVVPCCGIGNRIAVMMEALALAHAWSLAPSVNWVRGSVLGAAFGDLWETHPAFDRVVEVDATSDRGKSGGRGTCGRDGAAARSAFGFAEGAAVRDFADLTCAAPAGGPGSGPCVFASCGGHVARQFADVARAWVPDARPRPHKKRVWRVPKGDGKMRAVTSRDFFEGRDGRNVSAVRVDDAAFCSARVAGPPRARRRAASRSTASAKAGAPTQTSSLLPQVVPSPRSQGSAPRKCTPTSSPAA